MEIATLAVLITLVVISYIYGQSRSRERAAETDLPVKLRMDLPPIDDEEFLLRCPKGTNPENALKIRRIVAVQLGVEYERLYPTKRILEGLDC